MRVICELSLLGEGSDQKSSHRATSGWVRKLVCHPLAQGWNNCGCFSVVVTCGENPRLCFCHILKQQEHSSQIASEGTKKYHSSDVSTETCRCFHTQKTHYIVLLKIRKQPFSPAVSAESAECVLRARNTHLLLKKSKKNLKKSFKKPKKNLQKIRVSPAGDFYFFFFLFYKITR